MAEVDESKVTTTTPPVVEEKKPDNKAEQEEIARLKAALSRANTEAADWKRQLREKQTEQERADAERAEREKAREARIAELEAKERISTYTKKLMEAGADGATADLMAGSLPEGVADAFFDSLKAFNERKAQEFTAKALDSQKGLSVGTPPTTASAQKDEINRLRGYAGLPPLP